MMVMPCASSLRGDGGGQWCCACVGCGYIFVCDWMSVCVVICYLLCVAAFFVPQAASFQEASVFFFFFPHILIGSTYGIIF
jgi:hypothetical protein